MKKNFKNSNFYLIQRMLYFFKPYLFRSIIATIITIPIGMLDAAIAFSLKPYMDLVLIKQSIKAAWYIPVGIVGFTIIQGILNYISAYLNGWLGQKVTNDVKKAMFSKLATYESSFFDNNSSGNIVVRYNTDPELASAGLLNNIRTFLTRLFSSISLVGVLLYNSWQLAIIAIIVLGGILYPLTLLRKKLMSISYGMTVQGGTLITCYNEAFAGNKVVSAYNLGKYQDIKFTATLKGFFDLNMKVIKLGGIITPIMHITASIGIAAVIWYGSSLILTNQMSSGAFISFITALIMLYQPIKGMGSTVLNTQLSCLSIQRIFETLDYEPKIKNNQNPIIINEINEGISFENVYFEYKPEIPVLKGINLEVKKGETIAFVGNSGGGKTTIINLLPRFYDIKSGKILIDGIDIKEIDIHSLRNKMAIVFQDNFLFDTTIRNNILIGKFNATEEELQKVIKDSYLDEFINELPNGLDTFIGERGVLLSGGQKQRIAIARAMIKDAPIVILDEATSALDNKSEAIVQRAIEKLMSNKTVFVIAHRLSTIQNADKIVVLNNGQIAELGNHDELIKIENGVYKNLHNAQFKETKKLVSELI